MKQQREYVVQAVPWTAEEQKAWVYGLTLLVIELFLEHSSRQQEIPILENK